MKKYVFILIAVFNLDIVLGADNKKWEEIKNRSDRVEQRANDKFESFGRHFDDLKGNRKFVEQSVDDLEGNIEELAQHVDNVGEQVEKVAQHVDNVGENVEEVAQEVAQHVDKVSKRIDFAKKVVGYTMVALWFLTIGICIYDYFKSKKNQSFVYRLRMYLQRKYYQMANRKN